MTLNTAHLAALILPLLLAVGGCDKRKTQQAGASTPTRPSQNEPMDWNKMSAAIARDLPGRWEAWIGDPAEGFYSHMTLVFRADRTFTLTNVMPNVGRPGATIENVTDGHWRMTNEVAILDLEHARDGGPIREEERQVKLVCMGDGDINQMRIDHLIKPGSGGIPFYRPGAATRPTPTRATTPRK